MTRSYRDAKITIAAWANPNDRMPNSLAKRRRQPDIYATTKTAAVYGMDEPFELIVDDTHKPEHQHNYVLGPDQRDRIRSHIVWPILSPAHSLLGTFVLDCSEPYFFRPEDRPLWQTFCEAHSEPIALEKLRLDAAVLQIEDEYLVSGPGGWPQPPF